MGVLVLVLAVRALRAGFWRVGASGNCGPGRSVRVNATIDGRDWHGGVALTLIWIGDHVRMGLPQQKRVVVRQTR